MWEKGTFLVSIFDLLVERFGQILRCICYGRSCCVARGQGFVCVVLQDRKRFSFGGGDVRVGRGRVRLRGGNGHGESCGA